jgi:glyoxylase-like metal-dependent hydrolase (beta-lactamase superfamily II)
VEIRPELHQLQAIGCGVFALLDERVTLIDAGWPGSGPLILHQLRKLGRGPQDVERIILTHYHIDHRGAVPELVRATGAEVLIHRTEAPYLQGKLRYPNPVRMGPFAQLAAPLMTASRGRPVPAQELDDGDTVPVLGGMQVLHSPGHTRGSVTLWLPAIGVLLAGDTMGYRGRVLEAPQGRVSEDVAQARVSLERLAAIDIDTICFSHFGPLRGGGRRALERLVATWSDEFRLAGEA